MDVMKRNDPKFTYKMIPLFCKLAIQFLFKTMMYGFMAAMALLIILLLLITVILGVTSVLDTIIHFVL